MLVRFWGTRGSVPVPGAATVRYGGNTCCVQLVTASGTQLILDCGTGIRRLGQHLLATVAPPIEASLLLSHTHWDHIQGLPFFAPVYQSGNRLSVYAAKGLSKQLDELLAAQFVSSYFPIGLDQLRASITYHALDEEPVRIGDAIVQSIFLNHTTVCLGFRVSADGASVVYVSDHEPYTRLPLRPGGQMLHSGDARLVEFAREADLLIHDARYSEEEYPVKAGWGHSTTRYAASIAAAAAVKQLALFHHDPAHEDDFIDRQVERTRALVSEMQTPPEVIAAAEGQELRLAGRREVTMAAHASPAAARLPSRQPRVLIADDDRLVSRMVQDALKEDGYQLLIAQDGHEALSMAESERPDLLVLDAVMPRASGFEVCQVLRSREPVETRVPIILLTALDDPQHIKQGFKEGASDYITKPFTAAILRSRVRRWLVSSGVL